MNQSIEEMMSPRINQVAKDAVVEHQKVVITPHSFGTFAGDGTKLDSTLQVEVQRLVRLLLDDDEATVTCDTVQKAVTKHSGVLTKMDELVERFKQKEIDEASARVALESKEREWEIRSKEHEQVLVRMKKCTKELIDSQAKTIQQLEKYLKDKEAQLRKEQRFRELQEESHSSARELEASSTHETRMAVLRMKLSEHESTIREKVAKVAQLERDGAGETSSSDGSQSFAFEMALDDPETPLVEYDSRRMELGISEDSCRPVESGTAKKDPEVHDRQIVKTSRLSEETAPLSDDAEPRGLEHGAASQLGSEGTKAELKRRLLTTNAKLQKEASRVERLHRSISQVESKLAAALQQQKLDGMASWKEETARLTLQLEESNKELQRSEHAIEVMEDSANLSFAQILDSTDSYHGHSNHDIQWQYHSYTAMSFDDDVEGSTDGLNGGCTIAEPQITRKESGVCQQTDDPELSLHVVESLSKVGNAVTHESSSRSPARVADLLAENSMNLFEFDIEKDQQLILDDSASSLLQKRADLKPLTCIMDEIQRELEEAKDRLLVADQRVLALENDKAGLIESLKDADDRMPKLKQRLTLVNAKSLLIEGQLEAKIDELATMKNQLEVAEAKVSYLSEQLERVDPMLEEKGALRDQASEPLSRLNIANAQKLDDARQLEHVVISYRTELVKAEAELAQADVNEAALRKQNGALTDKLDDYEKALKALRAKLRMSESYIASVEKSDVSDDLRKAQTEVEALKLRLAASDVKLLGDSKKLEQLETSFLADINETRELLSISEREVASLTNELHECKPLNEKFAHLEAEFEDTRVGSISDLGDREDSYSLKQAHDELADLQQRVLTLSTTRFEDFQSDELEDTKQQLEIAEATILALHDELKRLLVAQAVERTDKKVHELELHLLAAEADLLKAKEDAEALEKGYAEFLEDAMESLKKSEAETADLRKALNKDRRRKIVATQNDLAVRERELVDTVTKLLETECSVAIAPETDVFALNEMRENLEKAEADLHEHKKMLAQSYDELVEANRTLRNLERDCGVNELSELPSKLSSLVEELADTQKELGMAEADLHEHNKMLTISHDALAEAKLTLRNLESECGVNEVSELPIKLSCLLEELADTHKKLYLAEADHDETKKMLTQSHETLAEANQTLRNLERDCGVIEVSELPSKLSSLVGELADMQKELDLAEANLDETKMMLTQSSTTLAEANQTLRNLERECGVNEVSELPIKLSSLVEELAETQKELRGIANECQRVQNDKTKTSVTSPEVDQKFAQISTPVNNSSDGLEEMQFMYDEREKELQCIEIMCGVGKISEVPAKISELENRLADAQKELKTTHRSSASLKEKLRHTEESLTKACAEASSLKQTLARLNSSKSVVDSGPNAVQNYSIQVARQSEPSGLSAQMLQMRLERKESEIKSLKKEIFDQQSQLNQVRALLWDLEEERNYNRRKLEEFSKPQNRHDGNELEIRLRDMSILFAEAIGEKDTLNQKVCRLVATTNMLHDEINQKNDLVRELSSRCEFSSDDFMKSLRNEQERALKKATDLSVELAESRMKIDELGERLRKAERAMEEKKEESRESDNAGSDQFVGSKKRRGVRRLNSLPSAIASFRQLGSSFGELAMGASYSEELATSNSCSDFVMSDSYGELGKGDSCGELTAINSRSELATGASSSQLDGNASVDSQAVIRTLKNKIAELESENSAYALSLSTQNFSMSLENIQDFSAIWAEDSAA